MYSREDISVVISHLTRSSSKWCTGNLLIKILKNDDVTIVKVKCYWSGFAFKKAKLNLYKIPYAYRLGDTTNYFTCLAQK